MHLYSLNIYYKSRHTNHNWIFSSDCGNMMGAKASFIQGKGHQHVTIPGHVTQRFEFNIFWCLSLSSLVYLRSFLLCLGCRHSSCFLDPFLLSPPVFTLISCFSVCVLLTSCVFSLIPRRLLFCYAHGMFSRTFMYFCQVFTVQVFHVHAQVFFMFSISSPSLG